MAESYDAYRYISYLRSRWRWIAVSAAFASALAVAVSFVMPRQYTATAQVVIEPPASSDPRSATALSPIYLESLKTYEHFAASDSLFQKAIDKFNLRAFFSARPIESIKSRVLKVATARNTRILEIAATLPDPRRAQALARYLAESTVALSQSTASEGQHDLTQGVEQQERETRAELDRLDQSWARLNLDEPVADLQSEISRADTLRGALQRQMLDTRLEMADAAERQKEAAVAQTEAAKEAANAAARLEEIRKQIQDLDRQSTERERLLAARLAHRDKLEADRAAARAALTAIETRLREARGDAAYRGERLRIIDPGIVPERPSSPNLPLNFMAALLLGLVLPLLYLTMEMNYQAQKASGRRNAFQTMARTSEQRQ
jgi:polysaccharide biosynthesis transport protein